MRVAEVAELTRTTVRTIRYYHQIGLLPVPPVVGGWREYDATAATRVARIRRLADAGVPLARIAALVDEGSDGRLGGETEELATTLRETLTTLDEEIDTAVRRRTRAERLLQAVEHGGSLAVLPPRLARLYEVMTRRAPDAATRRAVRSEQDVVELALLRGDLPADAVAAIDAIDGVDERWLAGGLELLAELGRAGAAAGPTAQARVPGLADRVRRHVEPVVQHVARSVDPAAVGRVVDLYARVADPPGPLVARRLADAVRATLPTGTSSAGLL